MSTAARDDSASPIAPNRRASIYEDVVEAIKSYVVDNGLVPGDRLPTEVELAERFGVSRLTVREAVKVLESLGVIHVRRRDGMRLRAFTLKPMADHLRFVLEAEKASIEEITEARQVQEIAILPLVARRATAQDFAEMEAAISAQVAGNAARSVEAVFEADMRFHLALLRAARNRALEGFGSMLQEFFRRPPGSVVLGVSEQYQSIEEHRALVAALRAGDAVTAQGIMAQHLGVYGRYLNPQRERAAAAKE